MSDFISSVDIHGDDAVIDSIIDRTITEFRDDHCEKVGMYVFAWIEGLKSVVLPNVQSIDQAAFYGCGALEYLDFGSVTRIATQVFYGSKLTKVLLRNTSTVCAVAASPFAYSSGMKGDNGYIYVPKALVDSYKVATNWSEYAAKFRALEDYTVDGTVTGELDETKI